MIINNNPWVKDINKLVLNNKAVSGKNIFCLHGWIFFNKPFISKEVLNEFIDKKIYGIKFVEVNKIIDFFNGSDYLKNTEMIIE